MLWLLNPFMIADLAILGFYRTINACNYRQDTYSHRHATDLATARQADVKDFHRLEDQIVAKQMSHDLQHADH
jgi:hypothetical protein